MPVSCLLLVLAAHANPIACELRGDLALAEDGRHVDVSFLGACDEIEGYDEALAVQVEDGDGWKVVGTHWERTGQEEAEGGSGPQTYGVWEQQVACPGAGATEFRVAWIDADGAEGWFGERIACEGHGWSCAAAGGPGSFLAVLCGLALLLPARRRR